VTKGADVRVLRLVTVVLAWLLLVAGVAAGAWFAVDAAGRAVGGPAESADVVLPPPVDVSLTPVSTPGPSGTPSPTGSAGVTPSASPSPSSTGRRAFIVPGGSLVVRCEGTVLVYWSVRPTDGWRVTTSQTSSSLLEVASNLPGGSRKVVLVTCRMSGPDVSARGA